MLCESRADRVSCMRLLIAAQEAAAPSVHPFAAACALPHRPAGRQSLAICCKQAHIHWHPPRIKTHHNAQDGEDWEDEADSAPSRRQGPKTARTGTQGQWGTTTIFGGEETATLVPSGSQRHKAGPAGSIAARSQATTARRQQQVRLAAATCPTASVRCHELDDPCMCLWTLAECFSCGVSLHHTPSHQAPERAGNCLLPCSPDPDAKRLTQHGGAEAGLHARSWSGRGSLK